MSIPHPYAHVYLSLRKEIRREEKAAPSGDLRRRITRVLVEYTGDDGHEYRKSFESYGDPVIPASGTNDEITKMSRQW